CRMIARHRCSRKLRKNTRWRVASQTGGDAVKQPLLIILGSALATGAFIKAAPALSQPAQTVSVVTAADLDLSTEAGRRPPDHRLVTAAYDVCGTAADVDL